MPERARRISILPGLCDGCGRCVEACKRVRKKIAAIRLIEYSSTYFPVLCRNCEHAPCVAACMTGCRYRNEEGWVVTDYSRCVGCWMCIMNCPFGAIERNEDAHVAWKCDGCLNREIAPCVAVCTRGALSNMDIRDMTTLIRKKAAARFLVRKEDVLCGM